MNALKICHWNANGISQHKNELKLFLNGNSIDMMLISETHLTQKNCFRIDGYKFYDTKHPGGKARGGTAILIKNRIKHFPMQGYCTDYLQATTIQLEEYVNGLTVSAIYCPPRFNIDEQQYKQFFSTLDAKFIAAGDFNAKHTHWGSRLITPKGRKLFSAINALGLNVLSNGKPTYWPSDRRKIPDLIDFAVTRGINNVQSLVHSSLELSSDHTPTIITIFSENSFQKNESGRFDYKRTDWLKYKMLISSHLEIKTSLKSEQEINSAIFNFTQLLSQAVKITTPRFTVQTRQECTPQDILKLLSEKRSLRRVWQMQRSPSLKKKLNERAKKLRYLLKQKETSEFHECVESLCPTEASSYSLWRRAKNSKKPIPMESPIRLPNGDWARSDAEKGIAFANHLEQVFTPNLTSSNRSLPAVDAIPSINGISIAKKELINAIKELNVKKSPGRDLITGQMIKELPATAVMHLLHILNAIIRTGFFPYSWKISQIIMIPKAGKDPTNVSSYRPISLLSIVSKLFENLIIKRIKDVVKQTNVIPNHQFGFREKHSTIEQVHRIVNTIHETFEKKQYCSAVFLDITQAFDKVWHEGILHKLKSMLPLNIYILLESYLSGRRFVVKYKTFISAEYPILAGVPQGSVLGPLLYTLFTADMPTDVKTVTYTFADDTAILCTRTNPKEASILLQEHVNMLQEWLDYWKIKVNESKCVHVTFTLCRSSCPPVQINSKPIPQASETKYLGIHLDRRLTWAKHISAKVTQIKLKINELNWLLNRQSKLKLDYKVLLYKAIIKPIWTYGIQLWGTASPSNIEKLQRTQSKILRMITKAPWYIKNANLHRDLHIPYVTEEISRLAESYLAKLERHPNALARRLLRYQGHTRLKRKDVLKLKTN